MGGTGGTLGSSDPLDDARKIAASFHSGQVATDVQKDIAVFPKPKEENGVVLTWGTANEAPAIDNAPGAKDSPDGLLFNCAINKDRLDPRTLPWTIFYLGHHIADLRATTAANEGSPYFVLEYNAWAISLVGVVSTGAKTVTMPDGSLAWDAAWPAADRDAKFDSDLRNYLRNEEFLSQ
jgi:hypothetical protein